MDQQDTFASRDRKLTQIKLSDQVAEDIRRWIAKEGLRPGDRLPHERALMERYGCSKGTIREALKALEVEGLVRMLSGPNGGPEIQDASIDIVTQQFRQYLHFQKIAFKQVYDLRKSLEVIPRGHDRDLASLQTPSLPGPTHPRCAIPSSAASTRSPTSCSESASPTA